LRVERTGEAAAHGYRLSTVHLPRGLGHRRVSLSATQRGFHGHPKMRSERCGGRHLQSQSAWRMSGQYHLKAFNHLTLPPPPSSTLPTTRDSNTRAWRRGHTSRAVWDPRTCNRAVQMEGRLVHGLVSPIQRHCPKPKQMRLMCCPRKSPRRGRRRRDCSGAQFYHDHRDY
jgi:hypothetical protein